MFLKGKRFILQPLDPETACADVARWLNDPKVTELMFYGQRPMNVRQVREMLETQVSNHANVVFLLVSNRKKPMPFGFAGLYDIHPTARKAEFRVLIGETSFWGKGIGTEVTELLTQYAFERLNLHRVHLGVTSENIGAIRAYEKAGYLREGVRKDDLFRNGRYYDSILMAKLHDTR